MHSESNENIHSIVRESEEIETIILVSPCIALVTRRVLPNWVVLEMNMLEARTARRMRSVAEVRGLP